MFERFSSEPEPQILDYVTQQHKLFISIATSHAFIFTSYWLWDLYIDYLQSQAAGNYERLPEVTNVCGSQRIT